MELMELSQRQEENIRLMISKSNTEKIQLVPIVPQRRKRKSASWPIGSIQLQKKNVQLKISY